MTVLTKKTFQKNPEFLGTDRLYTMEDLCDLVGITRKTLTRFIYQGILPVNLHQVGHGNKKLWTAKQVEEFLANVHLPRRD